MSHPLSPLIIDKCDKRLEEGDELFGGIVIQLKLMLRFVNKMYVWWEMKILMALLDVEYVNLNQKVITIQLIICLIRLEMMGN